jgi:hypothetical protein
MKVRELIEQLRAFHPDAEVTLTTFNVPGLGDGIWSDHPVEHVESSGESLYSCTIVAQS